MIIPVNELPAETLQRIAEDFATRDGTDYGEHEFSLEEKTQQLIAQIRSGTVLLSFDNATESLNLITAESYHRTVQEMQEMQESEPRNSGDE